MSLDRSTRQVHTVLTNASIPTKDSMLYASHVLEVKSLVQAVEHLLLLSWSFSPLLYQFYARRVSLFSLSFVRLVCFYFFVGVYA